MRSDEAAGVSGARQPGGGVRPAGVVARGWGWRHAGRKRAAVSGLDLDIRPGERVLLLGPSGAGKSTFLHAVAGVLAADTGYETGELRVGGAHADPARGASGLVLQDPDSQVVLARVGDDVAFGMENRRVPREQIWKRVPRALRTAGLPLELGHPTRALSGGQKQRLALAGVIAMRPGVMVLDEPTANLDPAGVLALRDAVIAAQAETGATLLVVEHRVPVWAEHVDRVVVLGAVAGTPNVCGADPSAADRGGRAAAGPAVIADGAPGEILYDSDLRDTLAEAGVWLPDAPAYRARRTSRADGEVLLRARGVDAGHDGRAATLGVDLELRRGEVVALVGPNGAGKTTTALTLAGLLAPLAGRVEAGPAGADPARADPAGWRPAELIERIGTVFQEPEHQFLKTSVADELAFGPRQSGQDESVADELARRLRLDHLALAHPHTLSGGEKRRLSVAAMLASAPDVLILDEPTFGQDAKTWRELVDLVSELLAEGRAVLVVSHDREFLAALGAREVTIVPAPRTDRVAPAIRPTPLVRAHPLAKLAAMMLLLCGVLPSVDLVSAGTLLALELLALPLAGLSARTMIRRLWVIPLAALSAAWATALLAEKTGRVLLDLGALSVTTGTLESGVAIGLRVVAIALPGVVLVASIDPTDLADGLSQRLRLPARFVLAALAAFRLMTLLVEEWQTLTLARRARGVASGRTPRGFAAQAFALLVQAIRRGTRLAMAMEARAFGAGERTWARASVFHWRDVVVVLVAAAMAAAAIVAALVTGAWSFILA